MSTLRLTTISNQGGTASVPSDTVINGTAKAWVNFNGTGTVAIRASFNVSSITDIGVGRYQINFTNSFADTNYVVVLGAGNTDGGGSDFNYGVDTATITTSSIRATYFTSSGAAFADTAFYSVTCFR